MLNVFSNILELYIYIYINSMCVFAMYICDVECIICVEKCDLLI